MPETEDLAAIEKALLRHQAQEVLNVKHGFPSAYLYVADAAILALERLRVRLANSVPAEQGELAIGGSS